MVKDFLQGEKKIFDPVHGFISFDEFEKELIDSMPFQRLHYIHQIGNAYLVYPGATHTRFEHSLGVMYLASVMFDKICKSIRPDAFHFVPRKGSAEFLYWKRVIRMAALCHDLGQLPFSKVAEKELLGPLGHEQMTLKIIDSIHLKPIWDKLRAAPSYLQDVTDRDIVEDIKKVSVGEAKWRAFTGKSFTPWERIVSEIIAGEFFGADRIDYLLRDAKNTGVSVGLFNYHELIEMLRILPSVERGADELQLGIDENGLESCEALLLAQHFMHRRVYQYGSVKAYNFHLRRFLLANYTHKITENIDDYLSVSDTDVISALNKAAKDPKAAGHADAKCLIYRQHRYRAIRLPEVIGELDLKEFRAKMKWKESEMEWEMQLAEKPPMKLCFPVCRRYMVIQKARDCSDLLLKVPGKKANWVYISPERDDALVKFLEERAVSQ